jgi:hypothetical protein
MGGIELVYSQQSSDFDKSKAYSNPRFFTTPRHDVGKVFIVGDWPEIVAAYEALGVPVERLDEAPKAPPPPTVECPPELTERIKRTFPAKRARKPKE